MRVRGQHFTPYDQSLYLGGPFVDAQRANFAVQPFDHRANLHTTRAVQLYRLIDNA